MSQCRHGHSHGGGSESRADALTKVGAVGEAVASFISDTFWLAGLLDLAANLEDDGLGASWYGLAFGSVVALLSAARAAYSHAVLNMSAQGDHDLFHHSHESGSHHECKKHHDNHLTKKQKLALLGDWISHTGDIAGPITFVASLAAKNSLPRWGKALVHCGATLFGGVATGANVRTCKKSMLAQNARDAASNGVSLAAYQKL